MCKNEPIVQITNMANLVYNYTYERRTNHAAKEQQSQVLTSPFWPKTVNKCTNHPQFFSKETELEKKRFERGLKSK